MTGSEREAERFKDVPPIYRPKSVREKSGKKVRLGGPILLILATVTIFILMNAFGSNNSVPSIRFVDNTQPSYDDAKMNTITKCEIAVERGLRSPRTAKFPSAKDVAFDGKIATLSSYVDAQNGFGAMIRTYYTCIVHYIGGETDKPSNWVLKDLDMKPR